MNSAERPHGNATFSVRSVLRRRSVFRISKPFLSKFITAFRLIAPARSIGNLHAAAPIHPVL
jgi:hypothetical protein